MPYLMVLVILHVLIKSTPKCLDFTYKGLIKLILYVQGNITICSSISCLVTRWIQCHDLHWCVSSSNPLFKYLRNIYMQFYKISTQRRINFNNTECISAETGFQPIFSLIDHVNLTNLLISRVLSFIFSLYYTTHRSWLQLLILS